MPVRASKYRVRGRAREAENKRRPRSPRAWRSLPGAPIRWPANCARAASVARRYLPQKSRSQAADRGHAADGQTIGWNRARRRIVQTGAAATATHVWELIRARDAHLRLRFENAGRRDAHIVILLERGANQLLQLLVLKNIPPLLVAERSALAWPAASASIVPR